MPRPLFPGPIPIASASATIALTIAGIFRAGPGAGLRAGFAVASTLLLATLAARWKLAPRRETLAPSVAYLPGAGAVLLLLILAALSPEGASLVALAMVAAALGLGSLDRGPEGVEYGDGHPCM